MKLIYVCSPLKSNNVSSYNNNIKSAIRYCRYVSAKGHIPFPPHLYFTTFLDDSIASERKVGMDMGLDMLRKCDELWAFGETISEGMRAEILLATRLNIPIRMFDGNELKEKECV